MKKTRKLLALVLALMMAFSCMAMPAMAHGDEDEGIMPLKPWAQCFYCGVGYETYNIPGFVDYENGCADYPFPHIHDCYFEACFTCPTHGTFYGPVVESSCPHKK